MDKRIDIVISGYYGFDNIGDEAVLYAIIKGLKCNISSVYITVLSNNPERTKEKYGVNAVNRHDIRSIYKVIKKSNMLISGGGSLLQDITSSKSIPYYLAIVKIAQLYKKKVIFYSQGIGPVNKPFSRWLMRRVVNKVDKVFLRDTKSKELLEKIGIKIPLTLTADPVLSLKPGSPNLYINKLLQKKKVMGVYIRPWKNEEQILSSLEAGLNYLTEQGYVIYLIPMYYKQDRKIAGRLKARIKGEVHFVDKLLTIDEILSYTSSFEFIIGMRLHSLIMAVGNSVPMLGISYDPKVTGFLKDMEIPYCIEVQDLTPDMLVHMLKRLIVDINNQQQHLVRIYKALEEIVNLPIKYIKEQLK